MAKVLNEERFNPSRLPGLSLWLDAQATTTISSTTEGVSSWSDRSEAGNTMNSTNFYVPGCQLWLDAADPNGTGIPAPDGATIATWKDKSGLGNNATANGTGFFWSKTSAPNSLWYYIASSSDGTKLAAVVFGGGIYTNANSGAGAWTQTSAAPTDWRSIASSSDGTKLVAGAGGVLCGIYTNANSGAGVWTRQTGGLPTIASWSSIASSSDGTKLAAVWRGGGIYTNANSGAGAWTQTSAPALAWSYIASSSDGTKLAVVERLGGVGDGGRIYTNASSGAGDWTQTSAPSANWASIASSSDGTKLAAVVFGGGIYTNANSGAGDWTKTSAPSVNWISIASSSDGTKLAAVVFGIGGGIYTSINSGAGAWTKTYAPNADFQGIASSADGTKLAVCSYDGGIYTGTYFPIISSTGLNALPTMNFNGSSWFLGATANTTSNLTVFAVVMLSGNAVNNSRIVSLATPTKVDYDTYAEVLALQQGYDRSWLFTGRNNRSSTAETWNFVAVGDSSTLLNVPYIAAAIYGGTGSTESLVVNGSVKGTVSTTGAFGYTSYGIGNYASAPSSSEPFVGQISEVIIFNTAVTTFQRQQIETYLSKKWGIPLSYSIPSFVPVFSPLKNTPIISNTLITNQPSIFFPPGAQMTSTFNSDLGSPTKPGCQLWLDAADTTTLTRAGSSVIEWRDKSGNGYNMNQTRSGDGFPVTGNPINGLNTVQFTTGSSIKQSTLVNGAKNFYWVGKIAAPTSLNGYFFFLMGGDYSYNWHAYTIGAGNTYLFPFSTNTPYVSPGIYNATASQYGGGSTAATNVAFSSLKYPPDGSLTMVSVSGITGDTYYQGLCYDRGIPNRGWCGDLAEVIIFNQPLTTAQHQKVEGYLATKWGLRANLPPSHPYFSVPYTAPFRLNPSTPVSKSIFMTYQTPALTSTMRFGIGDDVSGGAFGLSQTQYYISSPYQYGAGYGDTRWKTNIDQYPLPTVLSAIYDASAGIIRGDRNFNADSDVRESAMINIISNTPYSLGMSPMSSSIVTSASFHVCEIIAYNRALATTDRQMIEGYMAWKWGILGQLPNGHPYKEFPPSGEQVIIPSTPLNLMQGLVSWLDMADTSSYTLSGTTLKTLTDKAGGTLFTISGKPNGFSFSTIGSLPALVFPGNNTSTLLANTFLYRQIPLPSQGSACMVLVPKSQFTASKLGILGWGSPGNSLGNPALGYNAPTTTVNTLQSYNTSTGSFFGPSLNLAANTPTILFWAWYGGNMSYLSCNGTTLLTSTPGTTAYYNSASTDSQFYIGNDGGFGAQFTLGELVMYNQYGETPFRNLLEGHLAWKWGLQSNLPAYHPYYYSAPGLQSLTEVNALSQPSDIPNLTMWLDAADTTTLTLSPSFVWTDKSAVANHVFSTTPGNAPTPSNFGTARRPSVYFGPGKSATSTYNSGASTGQFSAFVVASIPTLSYLLISSGQFTTATSAAGANGQTFAFYGSNGSTFGVCSPYVSPGGTKVGPYSTICGATVELFASVSGLTTLGNLNFGSTVSGTCATIQTTPWVFGDCLGDSQPKSFHVHEFITYSRQLTTNERWIIEGYLYWKWMQLI